MPPRSVVLVAFPECQLLDISGPAGVFGAASDLPGARGYRVTVVSVEGGELVTSCGLTIMTRAAAEVEPSGVNLLLVVGGSPTGLAALRSDERMRVWARAVARTAERFGSVCTGAFAVAAWGLAERKRVATHWGAARRLAERFPDVKVDPAPLYVVDGKLWTSAGVTAGIDMALAMVAADEGEVVAASVARRLVLPLRRSGNQAQHSRLLEAQSGADGRYGELISWLAVNLDRSHRVQDLASRVGETERSFQRHFRQATGHPPGSFITKLRLERARDLLATGRSVKETARACGYATPEQLSRAYQRSSGAPPSTVRRS
jgi:transcriptional regulator GlxA family with amidase domain